MRTQQSTVFISPFGKGNHDEIVYKQNRSKLIKFLFTASRQRCKIQPKRGAFCKKYSLNANNFFSFAVAFLLFNTRPIEMKRAYVFWRININVGKIERIFFLYMIGLAYVHVVSHVAAAVHLCFQTRHTMTRGHYIANHIIPYAVP